MLPPIESTRPPLRQILVDSHIAAITIAILLLWSLEAGFLALWQPLSRVIHFLFTAVAILGIPDYSWTFSIADRISWIVTGTFLYSAILEFFAAWILSHWIYGLPPLRALQHYRKIPAGRNNV